MPLSININQIYFQQLVNSFDLFIMIREPSQYKPKTAIARLTLNFAIMISVFSNPELMQCICGPFTLAISSKSNLLLFMFLMETLRISFGWVSEALTRMPVVKMVGKQIKELLSVKYALVLLLKFCLMFEQYHRKKFYLHSFLLEGIILLAAIILDVTQSHNIKEAGELLIIEGLHRLSIIYQLTQTFCPNLILYYSFTNLIIFVMSQVQSQQRYGLKQSLYVKHDIYRFLFMSTVFLGIVSLIQFLSGNFKMLIVFVCCLIPLTQAIRNYQDNNFSRCSNYLLISGVIIAVFECIFTLIPFSSQTIYRLWT